MSTALETFKVRATRPNQHPAGVGAVLAYNEIIKGVLPPIVSELEKKIASLEEKLEQMNKKLEMLEQK